MGSSSRIRSSQNWLPGLGRNLFMVCQQKHACGYQLVKGGPHDKYWTLWEVSDNQNHYPKEAESKINHVLHPFPVTTLSREVLTFSLVCWNSFFPCDHTDLKTNKQTRTLICDLQRQKVLFSAPFFDRPGKEGWKSMAPWFTAWGLKWDGK